MKKLSSICTAEQERSHRSLRRLRRKWLVEIVEEAVEAAKENAKLNNLDNCTFWAGDVLKVIDELGKFRI